jgi:hypothetical protein
MWVFPLQQPYQFRCAPRPYNGGALSLVLRNEFANATHTIDINEYGYYNGIITINFSTPELNEGDSFEIELFEGERLLYRGKGYATEQTDLQNYKLWL